MIRWTNKRETIHQRPTAENSDALSKRVLASLDIFASLFLCGFIYFVSGRKWWTFFVYLACLLLAAFGCYTQQERKAAAATHTTEPSQ